MNFKDFRLVKKDSNENIIKTKKCICENIAQPQLGTLCDHIGCMKIALFAKCKFGCIIIVYFSIDCVLLAVAMHVAIFLRLGFFYFLGCLLLSCASGSRRSTIVMQKGYFFVKAFARRCTSHFFHKLLIRKANVSKLLYF